MDKLKLIKSVVAVLTFLLVLGSLVGLGSLYKKAKASNKEFPNAASLSEPVGSSIKSFRQDNHMLYIHVQEGGQNDRIVIFDASLGKVISKININ